MKKSEFFNLTSGLKIGIFQNVTEVVTHRSEMSASTKLSNAVKALCYLARMAPQGTTSSEIYANTGVNASKIRQILSLLKKNEMILSERGVNGGFKLNKDPEDINLQEIYCAIEDRKAFHLHIMQNGEGQADDKIINDYFLELFENIQEEIENKMKKISLKEILIKVKGIPNQSGDNHE